MNFPSTPQRFNFSEVKNLVDVLESNKLWPYPVTDEMGFVNIATKKLKSYFSVPYVVPTSSGTASIHTALGGLRIPAGSEVILPPITDAGTVSPIIFQNAIPVFADVDPVTSNLTADTIEPLINKNTSAVVVVHLAGCPVELDPIKNPCAKYKLLLIEDAAQALGGIYQGKLVGTFGDIGCFSLNDQKHITCGEGGFITVQQESIYFEAHNFHDKYYDRHNRGVRYHGIGLNYRLSELDGAMIISQLPKLLDIVEKRRVMGDLLTQLLDNVEGIITQKAPLGAKHSYFFYMFRIDPKVIVKKRQDIIENLIENGVRARGGYVDEPLYKTKVFKDKSFFAGGIWPAELVAGKTIDYTSVHLPQAELANSTTISFSFHHGLSEVDVKEIARLISIAIQ